MGEARWADERAALVKYRYDAVNLSARLEEAVCREKCLRGNDPETFFRLLALRKARMERFPYAFDYEARIEQIEGTALPDTDEELFARMQIVNGDFVAALDGNLCLTRVWRK